MVGVGIYGKVDSWLSLGENGSEILRWEDDGRPNALMVELE